MTKKQILVVFDPNAMKDSLVKWIGSDENHDMRFAEGHEKAIERAQQQLFDMVLIDTTALGINYKMLRAILPILNNEVVMLPYEGEPADELADKVQLAFEQKKVERLKRLLVLDASQPQEDWDNLPPFSAN